MNQLSVSSVNHQPQMMRVGTSLVFLLAVSVLMGCEDDSARVLTESPPRVPVPESDWRVDEIDGERAVRLAIDRDELRAQLAEASEQARATADEARGRWRDTAESQRHQWAVKWAAPVMDDENAVEHVWVRPLHWSRFRIEGVLLNPPDRALDAPGGPPARGEIVSFPAAQLSDWVRWYGDGPDASRDGGFTIDVLDRAAGPVQ